MNPADTLLARASTILTEPAARYDNFSITLGVSLGSATRF